MRTDARAAAILFDGTRAKGVRYVDDRDRTTQHEVFARKEVIVSGGTANTAKLLQISGIGPAALLRDLGVPVVADLPVGENFRDHYSARHRGAGEEHPHHQRDVAAASASPGRSRAGRWESRASWR